MLNRRALVLGTLVASAGPANAADEFIIIVLNNGADGKVTVWVEGNDTPILDKDMTNGESQERKVPGIPPKNFRWEHKTGDTKTPGSGSYGHVDKEDTIRVESA